MSRLVFAALLGVLCSGSATGQEVPGRDLWLFPLGSMAAPLAASPSPAGTLWNPAMGTLPPATRVEVAVSALATPIDQGVTGRLIAVTVDRNRFVGSLSFAIIGVSDLLRTETDPQSLGEIPYQTTVTSLGAARRWRWGHAGVALRYRSGRLDTDSRGVVAADAGVVIPRVFTLPVRVSASTFMGLAPGSEDATLLAAVDNPKLVGDSIRSFGGGYSVAYTNRRGTEHYTFATAQLRTLDVAGGLVRTVAYGTYVDAMRLGLGLRYARYRVAVAREDAAGAIGPSYQFLLSASFR